MEVKDRFDVKETPKVVVRSFATPKLQNAFMMLDKNYAKQQGREEEHEKLQEKLSTVRSGMGFVQNNMGKNHDKAFDLYLRFRESSFAALDRISGKKKAKSMAEVVAEIDAMSMETVMFSDAHMLETQIQQLIEIKKCFSVEDADGESAGKMSIDNQSGDIVEAVLESSKGARILLAVAHRMSSTLISRWLFRSSFKVQKIADGEEAWKLLQSQPFDLFVSDLELPRIGGCDLTRRIRKSENGSLRHIPVILMSSSNAAEKAYASGVTDFLSKPVGKKHLLKKVGTVLENAFYKKMIRNYHEITGNKDEIKEFDYDPSKVEIMVVDDDIVTRKLVGRWLTSSKYKIVACKTGVEAWKAIRKWTNEAKNKEITRMILSDVTMPELSGFKLLEWVMSDQNTKHIPIILMSAVHTSNTGKERSIQSGSQDFLVKPFTKQLLLHKIKTIMETIVSRSNRQISTMLRMQSKRR